VTAASMRPVGRPRNPELDRAILAAAERQLRELGYARMSLESVAAAAGTTVPSVRRRFGSKAGLAEAVISSLRVADLPTAAMPPRARALAILQNFHHNLLRKDAMAVVGTLLAEESRHPELLETFRNRLVEPRRALLRQALADGIKAGELPPSADPEVLASMLIGSFYARYLASSDLPDDWAERTLRPVWPDQPCTAPENTAVCERLRADREWLATQGVELSQFGPDPVSGKVRIYLARYSETAHQALEGRYGSAVVVDTESRQWRFT
jgi:AcrR family transcriptional regulator